LNAGGVQVSGVRVAAEVELQRLAADLALVVGRPAVGKAAHEDAKTRHARGGVEHVRPNPAARYEDPGGGGFGRRDGLSGDRYRIPQVQIARWVFQLGDFRLDLWQHLVRMDSRLVGGAGDQFEIGDKGARLARLIAHLIPQVQDVLLTTA